MLRTRTSCRLQAAQGGRAPLHLRPAEAEGDGAWRGRRQRHGDGALQLVRGQDGQLALLAAVAAAAEPRLGAGDVGQQDL